MAVLLVEDDLDCLYSLKEVLNIFGLEVVTAASHSQAKNCLRENECFQAIVLDGKLGVEDSLDLIPEAKNKFECPLIAVSSNDDLKKCQMEAGCTHECPKLYLAEFIQKMLVP